MSSEQVMELTEEALKGFEAESSSMPGMMTSLPCTPVEEERPGSSLSTASRSSRIPRPRLSRSSSLRIKPTSDKVSSEAKTKSDSRQGSNKASPSSSRGIVRSASFVTSRGMASVSSPSSSSLMSSSYHPSSSSSSHRMSSSRGLSHTPETPRRFSHAGSHVRRTNSVSERKSYSYAGFGSSPWSPGYQGVSRRPNFLPISSVPSFHGPSSLPLTPASQPETPSRSPDTDLDDGCGETDSVKSFGSVSSAVSCDAGLTRHRLNSHHHHGGGGGGGGGTSCWGGNRSRPSKYVLHCSHNHDLDPETYLTPTQRAARKIRELKSQLAEARREVHVRDSEIGRLTRELVELRLLKARTQQEEGSSENRVRDQRVIVNGNDASRHHASSSLATSTPTPKTSSTPSEGSEPELSRLMDNLNTGGSETGATASRPSVASPAGGSVAETTEGSVDLTRSLADSGHYDDLTSPCLSSRDPFEASQNSLRDRPTDEEEDEVDPWAVVEETEARLREDFERREANLKRNHMDEYHELKEKHNDRVEALLSKLSDANLKYFELRPMYDRGQEKIRELEREVTKLKEELTEAELRHQKMYLQMFLKGQQAAKLQADDEQEADDGSMSSLSSNGPMIDLLKQLSRTEEELEKMKPSGHLLQTGVPNMPSLLSFPGNLSKIPLAVPNAELLDGKQAINLYLQGRRQVLYQREVANRANNNIKYRNGELDPEVTLQFLKSAIYYYLTDKDNAKGHLRAIESILGYTESERYVISKMVKH